MKTKGYVRRCAQDEPGAVTVDWIFLSAAIVGLGIAAVAAVSTTVTGVDGMIESSPSDVILTPEGGTVLPQEFSAGSETSR